MERFPPVVLYSILSSVRRFEPDFYNHLCRRYHLDADRILGLFGEIDMLGPGQLNPVLMDLREHNSYHDIMLLAGRNTVAEYLTLTETRIKVSSDNQYRVAVGELLPLFCGKATFTTMMRGNVHFLEMWNSIFARQANDVRPLCSFYTGILSELCAGSIDGPCKVSEVRCRAVEPDVGSCLFQISL